MDESCALVEFSTQSRRVRSTPFDDAHIEVRLNFFFPPRPEPEDWQGAFRSLRESAAAGQPTLYDALGVDRDMPQEELKRVYRALAKEHHPDRRRDSGAAMTRINEAYAVLQDPAARKHYDRILEANV